MINVVLCGGYGSRLWPLSRKFLPKQFLSFEGDYSLFQQTVLRNKDISDSTLVILGEDHYFQAKDQLHDIHVTNTSFIAESIGRNTAPAIALAALSVDPEDVLMISASDHRITNGEAYRKAVRRAVELASEGFLVTFGIQPEYPETGYGYIEASGEDVSAFKEKPDFKTAESYIKAGNYYWNSGMFCFKAGIFLDELKKFRPDILDACLIAFKEYQKSDLDLVPLNVMSAIPKDSIDFAVMEKSDRVKVVACNLGWADLGSIDSLYEKLDKDVQHNMIHGSSRIINENSKNNLIISDKRTVSLIDVEDLNIVDTEDALLITKRGSSQKIKCVVEQLEAEGSELIKLHNRVQRPWGAYLVLENQDRFKVKRIEVKPGARLSLQRHQHRSEHWTVVQGQARIYVNDDILVRNAGEFIVIPAKAVHRLENIGDSPLIVVEVQMGDYLGEDDIERLEDDYAR